MDTKMTSDTLPEDVTFEAGEGLYWKNKHIGSFSPHVTCKLLAESESGIQEFVRLYFTFSDGSKSNSYDLPISDLEGMKWSKINENCQLNPDCTRAEKYLAYIIRQALSHVPTKKAYAINHFGLHIIQGEPMFYTGDRLIRSPNMDESLVMMLKPLSQVLTVDLDSHSKSQAFHGMMKIIGLRPNTGITIFSHSLLSVMRKMYIDIGITPCCIIFLVGNSGSHKTTYAAFQTQLFNRDQGIASPIRLNASIPAAEALLYENYNCTVLLDDLFPSRMSQIKRSQETTLIELTRIIGDNIGRARMNGKMMVAKQPQCGVIVTGEYLIGAGSDAARLLPVQVTDPIDFTQFQECQNEPLLLSSFYYYFIEWLIENYNEIQALLVKWLNVFRQKNMGVHARLQETYFCLETACRIFLLYSRNQGFVTIEIAQKQLQLFQNLLLTLVKEQNERVEQTASNELGKVDFLRLISSLYRSDGFRLADSAAQLKDKHDGLIHNGYLCLRGKKLMEKINQFVPSTNQDEVIGALVVKNVLKQGRDRRSIQITGGNGKRFYAIKIKKLY